MLVDPCTCTAVKLSCARLPDGATARCGHCVGEILAKCNELVRENGRIAQELADVEGMADHVESAILDAIRLTDYPQHLTPDLPGHVSWDAEHLAARFRQAPARAAESEHQLELARAETAAVLSWFDALQTSLRGDVDTFPAAAVRHEVAAKLAMYEAQAPQGWAVLQELRRLRGCG